ncbi:MAG: NAD-dependent epimerase/dehydratase family protein [Ruminococcus sp.]|uniref:SDR family oxidoreductase n=1 Tax=Ruminococcus sp. TaxID=41978 RepID=UPI001B1FAB3F|nr:NAD-dependent epimerase/dehydratase family protein [Ruminococcus sp.]MBO7472543.1 NAD-dependent epimerase/dehydratase family protein [Ruminococcus sp.]
MKILLIGGTGTISMAITKLLAQQGHEVLLLNRGGRNSELPETVRTIQCDISDEKEAAEKLKGMSFDCVGEFIGFVPSQVERDFRLFRGKTKQYIYISSASAYQKPLADCVITESTPLANPHWQYSRDKIACEEYLMKQYRENGFPVTIVRPSHTYDERSVPLGVHGDNGSWQVVKRIMEGKPVIIHGDGTSLWTITHNSDFAKAYAGLVGNIHAVGQAFHITSDESVTWNQIYSIIADELGVELNACHVSSKLLNAIGPYDFEGTLIGDKANTVIFDNSKIKRAVPDFIATIRADQGIRCTIRYILAHKECQTEDEAFDSWCDKVVEAVKNIKI